MIPARRARETPIMSANEKRFHSSPSGPHQSPPSLRTPSTSSANPRIDSKLVPVLASLLMPLDHCSHAAQFLDDWELALVNALHAVPFRLLPESNVANQARDAIRFQGGCVVGAPHRTIHGDMALDTTCTQNDRAN